MTSVVIYGSLIPLRENKIKVEIDLASKQNR